MSAGGGVSVQLDRELSRSTMGQLEGVTGIRMVEQ